MISPYVPLVGDEETTGMNKTGRNDPCPCGSGRKYNKCCLAETFVQVGKEESIRNVLLIIYWSSTLQTLSKTKDRGNQAHKESDPKDPRD